MAGRYLGGGLELICCRFSFAAVVVSCSHKTTAHSLLYLSGESEILYCIEYIVFTYIYINLKSDKLSSNFLCYFLWVFSGFWLWLCTHSASSARFRLAINDLFFFIISISSHTINIHSSKFYIYYSSRKMSFFSYVVCFLAFFVPASAVYALHSLPLFSSDQGHPQREAR